MGLHIKGKDLYETVRHLAPIARTSPLSAGHRLRVRCASRNTLEFTAVGSLLTVRTYANFDGEGFDDDAFVDADVLYKMSQKLKKNGVEFELIHGSGDLELRAGNISTTFPRSDGPITQSKLPDGHTVMMPASAFADVMKEALPYASTDDQRAALCAVFIDDKDGSPNVTATDGHRLYVRRFTDDEWALDEELPRDGVLLSGEAVKYALKLVDDSPNAADVVIHNGERKVAIAQGGVFRIDVDRIEATFPDFRAVLPAVSKMHRATFDAAALKDALDVGAPFLSKSEAVKIVYNGSVQVQLDGDAGTFDADIGGEFDGDNARLSFNAKYLRQACDTLGGDTPGGREVRQYVGDSLEPQVFVRDDDHLESVRVIVMPMRL